MSVYRYYLPGVPATKVTDDTLAALGLSERLRDCTLKRHKGNRIEVTDFLNHGPDGSSGAMVTPLPADRKGVATLQAGTYEAHKSQHGAYWIVWDKRSPPTPEGLERWEMVSGVVCELGDGRLWECPTIRTCVIHPAVPKAYARLNGTMQANVLPQYQRVWGRSAAWSLRLLEEYRETPFVGLLGLEAAFDAAVECVGLNYRVADEEVSLLQLLNDTTIDEVIDAAIDRAWFSDITDSQKKTELWREVSEGFRSSLRGVVEGSQPTNPADPISS
jgi:hypothetical protein